VPNENLPALEAVLAEVDACAVDGIIDAGDLVGGPQPVECIRLLRERGAWMIRGNSDSGPVRYAAGEGPAAWRTHLQFALLRWTHQHLDRETLTFLTGLPEQRVVEVAGAAPIRVVHGSPRDPTEHLVPQHDPDKTGEFRRAGLLKQGRPPVSLEWILDQIEEPVLVCGHAHIPWAYERAGRLVLNPGSVAGPLNGCVGAQYALLTWEGGAWCVEHRVARYDLDLIRAAFRDSSLLEGGGALARAFLLSIETGRNVAEDYLAYARSLAARRGLSGSDAIPDRAWEEAAATYDWPGAAQGRLACLLV